MTDWKAVFGGSLANGVGHAITIFIQLISVPVLLLNWGPDVYAKWVLISTIPSYISMADLGLLAASANEMTMLVAAGQIENARSVLKSTWAFVVVLCLGASILMFVALELTAVGGSQTGAVMVLVLYAALSVHGGLLQAAFQSSGRYATGQLIFHLIRLCEGLALVCSSFFTSDLKMCAIAVLLCRVAGISAAYLAARSLPITQIGTTHLSFRLIRKLWKPALASLALPMGHAFSLQGTLAVVGWAGDAMSIVQFSACRTLSRTGVQAAGLFNQAVIPQFAIQFGRRSDTKALFLGLALANATLLILYLIVTLMWGDQIFHLWLPDNVEANSRLLKLLALAGAAQIAWTALSTSIFASNQHGSFAWFYLACSCSSVIASVAAATVYGVIGVGWVLVISELAVLLWVIHVFQVFRSKLELHKLRAHANSSPTGSPVSGSD